MYFQFGLQRKHNNKRQQKKTTKMSEDESSFSLQRCFFAYDEQSSEEDTATEHMLLFFYPPDVSLEKQVCLLGSCSALINFADNFTGGEPPVRTLTLSSAKLALLRPRTAEPSLRNLTWVLSGPVSDDDQTICSHLEALYEAFCFYSGSVDHVVEQCQLALSVARRRRRVSAHHEHGQRQDDRNDDDALPIRNDRFGGKSLLSPPLSRSASLPVANKWTLAVDADELRDVLSDSQESSSSESDQDEDDDDDESTMVKSGSFLLSPAHTLVVDSVQHGRERSYDVELRGAVIEALGHAARELAPLLDAYHRPESLEDQLARVFQPVAYTRLRSCAARHFVAASQLLASVLRMNTRDATLSSSISARLSNSSSHAAAVATKNSSGGGLEPTSSSNLAGCLLFDNTVLCSQFDARITRWILCCIYYRRLHPEHHNQAYHPSGPRDDDSAAAARRPASRRAYVPSASGGAAVEVEYLPVFLSNEQMAELRRSQAKSMRKQRSQVVESPQSPSPAADAAAASSTRRHQDDGMRSPLGRSSSLFSFASTSRRPSSLASVSSLAATQTAPPSGAPEYLRRKHEHGAYAGLYILSLQRVSLAVLMELPALYDRRHISRLRLASESPLFRLQATLVHERRLRRGDQESLLVAVSAEAAAAAGARSSPSAAAAKTPMALSRTHVATADESNNAPFSFVSFAHAERRLQVTNLGDADLLDAAIIGNHGEAVRAAHASKTGGSDKRRRAQLDEEEARGQRIMDGVKIANSMFCERPRDVKQMILGDDRGILYCSNTLNKAAFFWRATSEPRRKSPSSLSSLSSLASSSSTPVSLSNDGVERIEADARATLARHSQHIL
jgi:First Longin domain of INTU, CCZ1 and HPS4